MYNKKTIIIINSIFFQLIIILNLIIIIVTHLFNHRQEQDDVVTRQAEEVAGDMKVALSGLEAAEKVLRGLDKKDLVEVRSMNKPPELVVLSLEPLCLLLGVRSDDIIIKNVSAL